MKSKSNSDFMEEKRGNKKLFSIVIAIILIIAIVGVGISYAYFRITKTQTEINKVSTACLKIAFEEDEASAINLQNAYPITDEEGLTLTPYTFKVTNNCSSTVKYAVNLDILTDLTDEDSLQLKYVKSSLNSGTPKLLSKYDDTTSSVDSAYSSKKLYIGSLKGNASKSFELRLWLDEDTPLAEGTDKTFLSKIVVINTDEKQLLATYIKELSESDTTNLAYDGTEDNNLRYIGADPSNYLCFDEDCSNGKWRVIGIMNNMQTELNGTQSLVKIIRADRVGQYAWDSNNVNDWTTASLNTLLNSGDLYETYIKDYDNLFESVKWGLGGTASYTSSSNGLASHFYGYERGTTVYSGRPTEWTGKIGLMYPSDYGYATSGGSTTDRETCLAKELYNWDGVSECYKNDYLYNSSYWQWTLMPRSSYSSFVFIVGTSGSVYGSYRADNTSGSVRPVGYLISTASISNGEGTNDEPWIISMS